MERAHAIYPRPDMLKQNRKKAGAVPAGRKEPSKETLAALRLGGNRVVVVGLLGGSLHGKARLLGILADSALPQARLSTIHSPVRVRSCRVRVQWCVRLSCACAVVCGA
jgi:hypothetical protein